MEAETTEQLIDDWYAVEELRRDIENDDIPFFVAERERVVGFISPVVNDETSKFELADHEVEFRQIYVDPDHWRSGVGTRLNDRAYAEAAASPGHEVVAEVEISVAGTDHDATVHAFDIPT